MGRLGSVAPSRIWPKAAGPLRRNSDGEADGTLPTQFGRSCPPLTSPDAAARRLRAVEPYGVNCLAPHRLAELRRRIPQ